MFSLAQSSTLNKSGLSTLDWSEESNIYCSADQLACLSLSLTRLRTPPEISSRGREHQENSRILTKTQKHLRLPRPLEPARPCWGAIGRLGPLGFGRVSHSASLGALAAAGPARFGFGGSLLTARTASTSLERLEPISASPGHSNWPLATVGLAGTNVCCTHH